jgi:hypothetical protein
MVATWARFSVWFLDGAQILLVRVIKVLLVVVKVKAKVKGKVLFSFESGKSQRSSSFACLINRRRIHFIG